MAMVGWVGAGMEVVDSMHVGQSQGDWSYVGSCRSTFRIQGDTLMTPDHTAVQVCSSGYGRAKLVGLPGKALTRDVTRRLLFVIHGAGWQHSMRLHGRNFYCSTDEIDE